MEKTLGEDEESSEEDLDWDDDQRISNMRRALQQCTPGSLRHRQIASTLQMRLREREEQRARDEQIYRHRRDSSVARGVPRAHADLLPKNISDPLPTQPKNDLDVLRQKSIEEEKETEEIESNTSIRGRLVKRNGKRAIQMPRKIPPTSRPLSQGKPEGLRRSTLQQAQASPSVTWNLQNS